METKDQALRSEEVSRSQQAKQILQNKIFKEAIDSLKKLYSEALLEKTGAKESDTREKLWIAYNVVGKVEQHLQTVIETGKLAEKQLEDFRKQQKQTKF
jgi:hypothetical protein